jgi:DNA-binding NtrC family response regulator
LCAHEWEGNARELENVIERAIAFTETDELGSADFPECGASALLEQTDVADSLFKDAAAGEMTLTELGDRYTAHVLAQTGGNKARAAKILGINRRTLYRRGFGGCEDPDTSNSEVD